MNTNDTEIDHSPSEPSYRKNTNESNINQLLSIELVVTAEPLIPFNTTDMITSSRESMQNVPVQDNTNIRQQARQRRRQKRREQRGSLRWQYKQQRRQQLQQRLLRQQRRDRSYQYRRQGRPQRQQEQKQRINIT